MYKCTKTHAMNSFYFIVITVVLQVMCITVAEVQRRYRYRRMKCAYSTDSTTNFIYYVLTRY